MGIGGVVVGGVIVGICLCVLCRGKKGEKNEGRENEMVEVKENVSTMLYSVKSGLSSDIQELTPDA